MIKKLTLAATFAAAALATATSADARNMVCMMKYEEDLAACQGNTQCEIWADIMFNQCLQALADSIE